MLLTARKLFLIHFLMRLPDFVRPVVAAADRFLQRIQKEKLFLAASCLAVTRRTLTSQHAQIHRRRWRCPQRRPSSKTTEG
jgi:hypothetical protein